MKIINYPLLLKLVVFFYNQGKQSAVKNFTEMTNQEVFDKNCQLDLEHLLHKDIEL